MQMLAGVKPPYLAAVAVATAVAALTAAPAAFGAGATAIGTDPFTQSSCAASTTTNHMTTVEPDTFAAGSTIVSAYQVGRIYDGGACAIGFATSTNNGSSWTSGLCRGSRSTPASRDRTTARPMRRSRMTRGTAFGWSRL
jgi:hypothetical protein